MTTEYFSLLPKTSFKRENLNGIQPFDVTVPDIFIRFKIKNAIASKSSLFYPYIWKDHDTPETVAFKYYGDSKYFWVVFYSNEAFDLNYDFAMPRAAFNKYLLLKYQTEISTFYYPSNPGDFFLLDKEEQVIKAVDWARDESHPKMYSIDDPEIIVDYDTYLDFNGVKRAITFFEYEDELNEAKRNVQLIDSRYLPQLAKEFTTDMAQARLQQI